MKFLGASSRISLSEASETDPLLWCLPPKALPLLLWPSCSPFLAGVVTFVGLPNEDAGDFAGGSESFESC